MEIENQPFVNNVQQSQIRILKFTLLMFGVSSLSSWNAILTGLDYFHDQFPDYKVYFSLPIPFYLSQCIVALALPKISKWMSYDFKIAYALMLVICAILTFPIIAQYFNNIQGYLLLLSIMFGLGCLSSLFQNTAVGVASILGDEYLGFVFVGTGVSGIIICLFRFISLFNINSLYICKHIQNQATIMYITVAAILNLTTLSLYFASHSTLAQLLDQPMIQNPSENGTVDEFFRITQFAFPTPHLIFILYATTFTMFPGLALQAVFSPNYQGISSIIMAYNIGDTLGKSLAAAQIQLSESVLSLIVIFRILFLYPYLEIQLGNIQNEWLIYINTLIFAILNGFCTIKLMQIGANKVIIYQNKSADDSLKEKIGFVQGFGLILGIFIGNFISVLLIK